MIDRQQVLARIRTRLAGPGKPWAIRNADGADGPAEVRLYSEIGFFGIDADQFAAELDEITASEIVVAINSPGGDVFDSVAIHNILRQHRSKIITRIDGLAASGASVVAQAGDHRIMVSGSTQMAHEAWGISIGPAEEMRKYAALLDQMTATIAKIYADRSGRPVFTILDLLKAESWFTPEEAVAAKFADEVLTPQRPTPQSRLPASEQAIIREAERHLLKGEIEAIARKVAVEAEWERFNKHLVSDNRPTVAYTEATPDAGRRDTATAVVAAAARDLGIDVPTVRWFRQASGSDPVAFESTPCNGWTIPADKTVWLSSTIPVSTLVQTAAHETSHIAGRDELGAQIYAAKFAVDNGRIGQ